ncbi:hypothetical protein H072_9743 [Dactylellina haptotyla CBS 200.50]|uniref:Zona occludens toxin N-terminal domain-containing protein n=1 Tax=Dactylellina haptotyla (strain CBS 200.50) TaxID=1284197 RepID=S8BBW3_DACHA|nr:hypothetical protein H072_9743 [Dactylellina haptotyla CBS 200.50]
MDPLRENILHCWLYDQFYQHLSKGNKKVRNEVKLTACLADRPDAIRYIDSELIKAMVNKTAKHGAWRLPPTPLNEEVKGLFPQWALWMTRKNGGETAPSVSPVIKIEPPPAAPKTEQVRRSIEPTDSYIKPTDNSNEPTDDFNEHTDDYYLARVVAADDADGAPSQEADLYASSQPTSSTQINTWRRIVEPLVQRNSLFPDSGHGGEPNRMRNETVISHAPLFTADVIRVDPEVDAAPEDSIQFSTFAQICGPNIKREDEEDEANDAIESSHLFLNTHTAWTTFICGLQGAGKSHTLSVIMENCLIPNKVVGVLPRPLAGLVFYYSSFTPLTSGKPCEVAYLAVPSSNSHVSEDKGPSCARKVTVLASRSNLANMKKVYEKIPNVTVQPLLLKASQLTAKIMLHLMAVQDDNNALYLQVVTRILREMAAEDPNGFSYEKFKRTLATEPLTNSQWRPLDMRLELLESFIGSEKNPNQFSAAPGTITIVDLTCPFVDAETACLLFSICLDLFGSASCNTGKIVALDEAHKFMSNRASSQRFAESIIQNIRLQRHLGLRTVISTQDPDVHSELLELSNFIIMHRFDSPRWLEVLKHHVGFGDNNLLPARAIEGGWGAWDEPVKTSKPPGIFDEIMGLNPGEALLYCPQLVTVESQEGYEKTALLRNRMIKVLVRRRLTKDGGVTRTALGTIDL